MAVAERVQLCTHSCKQYMRKGCKTYRRTGLHCCACACPCAACSVQQGHLGKPRPQLSSYPVTLRAKAPSCSSSAVAPRALLAAQAAAPWLLLHGCCSLLVLCMGAWPLPVQTPCTP